MMSKKILILFVVGTLFFTSFSSVASARISILSGVHNEKDTGTIVLYREKEKFIIEGDNGIVFLGKTFYKYLPLNLPEEFRKEGLKVKFTATICLKKIFTMDGLWYLIRGILPITLISIEKIKELKIIAPSSVDEGKVFGVRVVDSSGEPVEKAMVTVSWLKCEKCVFYTDKNGFVKLVAPRVEKDTVGYITATKTGYSEDRAKIIIKDIRVHLDFDISLKKQRFKIGEPIEVVSTLTNLGEDAIRVREMWLGWTLALEILTPDGKKLDYIGDVPNCPPELKLLKPGEKYSIVIKLNDNLFGYIENHTRIPYDFEIPGKYSISGSYVSFGPTPCDEIQYDDIWEGKLVSPEYEFEIVSISKKAVIKGHVYDGISGKPIEGAEIFAEAGWYENGSYVSWRTYTDERGSYSINIEGYGLYLAELTGIKVTVSKLSYMPPPPKRIKISAGDVIYLDFWLQPLQI